MSSRHTRPKMKTDRSICAIFCRERLKSGCRKSETGSAEPSQTGLWIDAKKSMIPKSESNKKKSNRTKPHTKKVKSALKWDCKNKQESI